MDHQSHEPARFWYYYDFSPLQPGRYYCGDCFQLLPAIESGTVDMVLIDPPYYMGKDKAWDCFEGRADYMAFMGRAFIQAQRILKENGTLGFWHNDLQKITWLCDWLERNTDMRFATWGIWVKPNHRRKIWVNPGPGNTLRSWFNIGEFCVFFVKGTAGTAWNKTGLELAKLNTENFGSLRDYFRRLLEYTDVTKRQIIETVGQSADHCFRFGSTQWLLPTRETKQNAVYQEIEIYTVGTDQKSRQREKQKVTPVPFRGKNPEHWDGHNAKRARKWFIRLLNTNFTEADTHTSLTYSDEFLPKTEEEADRDISNFLRRLRTKCKARGLPAPEAITVTEHQDADPDTGQKRNTTIIGAGPYL